MAFDNHPGLCLPQFYVLISATGMAKQYYALSFSRLARLATGCGSAATVIPMLYSCKSPNRRLCQGFLTIWKDADPDIRPA
jgi:hypothetical protein